MQAGSVVLFPREKIVRQAMGKFQLGDHASYYCEAVHRRIHGIVRQIEMDPLSGRQFRILLDTPCTYAWVDYVNVKKEH